MKAVFLESLPYESAFRVGSHHYADCFLRDGWSVLWVSHPISPLHFLARERRDFAVRVRAWRGGPLRYGDLFYYSPFALLPSANAPLLRSRFVVRRASLWTVPNLVRVLERHGFSEPDLVWLTNPTFLPIARRVRPRRLAVRVADDTAEFRNVPAAVRELEREAMGAADALFVVSRALHEKLEDEYPAATHLPNGVDYEHFATPRAEPRDLAGIGRPRVIYVGSTEYWFDARLVAEAARALPHARFVVIGPITENSRQLEGLPNVHLLGPRPYSEVPAYLQHADVGIIPFHRDPMVDAIHPIKLYEYCAAGLPVVATRWRELELIEAPVSVVEPRAFVDALREALAHHAEGRDARLAFARENSWSRRYEVARTFLRLED